MLTDAQWEKIRIEKQINIQTLACLHDAVNLIVAEINNSVLKGPEMTEGIKERTKMWLDILYDIAEAKKKGLTEIKPVSIKDAKKADKEFRSKMYPTAEKETLEEKGERIKQEGTKEKLEQDRIDWHNNKDEDEKL